MLSNLNLKRIKFVLISLLVGGGLFSISYIQNYYKYLFLGVLAVFSFVTLIWALQIFKYPKKVWFFSYIMPAHIIGGAMLAFYGFPNLSLILRVILGIALFLLYYITLLVLNIFIVVGSRDKPIPLYRVAMTWTQILVVVISIPVFAGIFKLPVSPFLQLLFVSISAFVLILFFLWVIDLESGFIDINLALLSAFWVQTMALCVLFLPFEATFRGLFLSSVLLFGLGYAYGYVKHNLTKKILIEQLIIIICFLLISLLFIP